MILFFFLLILVLESHLKIANAASTPKSVPSTTNAWNNYSFIFVISPGHVGTHSLFEWFEDIPGLVTVHEHEPGIGKRALPWQHEINFDDPVCDSKTQKIIADYVKKVKMPQTIKLIRSKNATSYMETGHQITFGLMNPLIKAIGPERVKIVRLRRDRIRIARSYFLTTNENVKGPCAFNVTRSHMVTCPFSLSCSTYLPITPQQWARLNPFQQYMWYVDNVEFLWGDIVKEYPSIETLEIAIEDSDEAAQRISEFIGYPFRKDRVDVKYFHHVNAKEEVPNEEDLKHWRAWDYDYQKTVFGKKNFFDAYHNHNSTVLTGKSTSH